MCVSAELLLDGQQVTLAVGELTDHEGHQSVGHLLSSVCALPHHFTDDPLDDALCLSSGHLCGLTVSPEPRVER